MFILYAVFIGLLLGYITGGRLSHLSDVNLRWKSIALLAFGMQLLLFSDIPLTRRFTDAYIVPLHMISYIGLLVFVLLNVRIPGIAVIGAGIFSNFFVIVLNKGYMPTTLERVVQGTSENNVIGMSQKTLLPWLGDVFHLPSWLPLSTAFSIGDVLIAMGICVYLIFNMKVHNSKV